MTATHDKQTGAFYPGELVARLRANVSKSDWAGQGADKIAAAAQPWLDMSDDELWDLMFAETLPRAWHVFSNGWCPACKGPVPMYEWVMDALNRPWKTMCPHCGEAFPKNDFHAFYRSGLDEKSVFRPELADRSLLLNADHADPDDPLYGFGMDDGAGWRDGDDTWLFIAAYLVYGQWKQAVVGGINKLSEAYLVTGRQECARKAAIMLDRVADLYPGFDFGEQGALYERHGDAGYVSTWHDACEETRQLALAWDMIFDAVRADDALTAFLSQKAHTCGLDNPRASFADVQRNIEDRILRDALASQDKIHSNFPRTVIADLVFNTVLRWPQNREEILAGIGEMIEQATACDGVTGEKGLPGYTCYTIRGLAAMLMRYENMEPGFIAEMLRRHPRLHQTWRFHIDTWCLQQYYPSCGDALWFAARTDQYHGVGLPGAGGARIKPTLAPSMFTFLWRLYEATGDAAFVQALWRANGDSAEGLPGDLFLPDDPASVQQAVRKVIDREGAAIRPGSLDKKQWHIAILRSGEGERERAAWLDYDAGGGHGHADGMNLGLFAMGLDLLPDLGYPPVQFGGWNSPRANWYRQTASHNTVVVDGQNQTPAAGETTLWIDQPQVRVVRCAGAGLYEQCTRYERSVFMVDISETDFYLLDVFRVVGGHDHAKFTHSHFGAVTADGLTLRTAQETGFGEHMREFRCDPSPSPGWSVDWSIEDRYGLLDPDRDVRLRHIDLSTGAEAWLCEGWIVVGRYSSTEEAWVPRVMTRRRCEDAIVASTFVSVLAPYEGTPTVESARRLPLEDTDGASCPDSHVAVEVAFADGARDLIVAADPEERTGSLRQPDWGLTLDGEVRLVRRNAGGTVVMLGEDGVRFGAET